MHRRLLHSPTSAVVMTAVSACVRSTPSKTSPPTYHAMGGVAAQTQRRCLHSGAVFTATKLCRFDLRQHELEKRRLRELEKAGVDPNDADEQPWIGPEEQQRLDEEEEQRRAELEEQRKAFLQKRAEEDSMKRQKFKEFRAKQISMSRQRKTEEAEKKEESRQRRKEQHQRVVEEGGAAAAEEGEEAKNTEPISNDAAGDASPMGDKK